MVKNEKTEEKRKSWGGGGSCLCIWTIFHHSVWLRMKKRKKQDGVLIRDKIFLGFIVILIFKASTAAIHLRAPCSNDLPICCSWFFFYISKKRTIFERTTNSTIK